MPLLIIGQRRDPLKSDHLVANLGARSTRGAVLALGGQGLTILMQIGNMAILARLLDASDFGVFALAMVLVGFTGIFANLGLSTAAVQMEELDQKIASSLLFVNILLGFIVMVICLVGAPIMGWYFDQPEVVSAIVFLALPVPLAAATVQFNALLTRGMRWGELQLVALLSQLAGLTAGIGSASAGAGYMALVYANAATIAVRFALSVVLSQWWPSRIFDWRACRNAIKFGAHMTGFTICNFLHKQADIFLIGRYWGATETGYYNRAYQLMVMPLNAINGPLSSVFVPALSRLQNDPARWGRVFLDATVVTAFLGCIVACPLVIAAPQIIPLVMGSGWEETVRLFAWLSLSITVTFPMGAAAWAFISRGRSREMFHWGMISTGVLVLGFVVAVPMGAMAVAQAYTVLVILLTPVCFWMALSESSVSLKQALIELGPLWSAAAATILLGQQIELIQSYPLMLNVIANCMSAIIAFLLLITPFLFIKTSYRSISLNLIRMLSKAWAN